ncbi:MAG: DoxX family protein [Alphaproteobacteria bacterium]|nr:DoxX family protein [Alphaproteobacteria bacterium]
MDAKRLGYWTTTGLTALVMLGSGLGKLTHQQPLVESMEHLGYPEYLLTILGIAYLAAAVVILAPRLPRLKEWAYAGIIIAMFGAFASHLLVGDGVGQIAPAVLIAGLALGSYALRPDDRRLASPAEAR